MWFSSFRIVLPLLVLLKMLSFSRDFNAFFFDNGIIRVDILSVSHSGYWIKVTDIANFFVHQIGISSITFDYVLSAYILLYAISLLSLSLGFITKISNILVLFCHLTFYTSYYQYTYGVDNFITILLFYLLISKIPENTLSLDSFFFKKNLINFGFHPAYVIKIIQIHLCIVYFFSGFEKALGYNWWNGESIWRALHNDFGIIPLNLIDKINWKWLFVLSGWITIAIELLYPIFVNIKKTKRIWLIMTIGMHFSITVLLGLFHFGAIMILFNLVGFILPSIFLQPFTYEETAEVRTINL